MLRPRSQPADIRVGQILDAAETVLLQRGPDAATVAEMAATAGLGKGTVYLYFDSKQAIVAGIRRRYLEQMGAEVERAIADAGSFEAKVEAAVLALVASSTRRPDLHHLLFHQTGFSERDAFRPIRQLFTDLIGSQPTSVEADLASSFVLGGLHEGIVIAAHDPGSACGRAADLAALVLATLGRDRPRPGGGDS